MKCEKCGVEIEKGSAFCSECGTKVKNNDKVIKVFVSILIATVIISVIALVIFFVASNNSEKHEQEQHQLVDYNWQGITYSMPKEFTEDINNIEYEGIIEKDGVIIDYYTITYNSEDSSKTNYLMYNQTLSQDQHNTENYVGFLTKCILPDDFKISSGGDEYIPKELRLGDSDGGANNYWFSFIYGTNGDKLEVSVMYNNSIDYINVTYGKNEEYVDVYIRENLSYYKTGLNTEIDGETFIETKDEFFGSEYRFVKEIIENEIIERTPEIEGYIR